jgi:hypothetical protein
MLVLFLLGLLLFYQRLHVDLCKLVLFDTKAKNIIKNEKKKRKSRLKCSQGWIKLLLKISWKLC